MSSKYVLCFTLFLGLVLAGCSRTGVPVAAPGQSNTKHDAEDHGHAKGIVAMGDYHAKLIVEQGKLKLFILGQDESKVAFVETQTIQAQARSDDATEFVSVSLAADPQSGDPAGKTSQFTGDVPGELRGKALVVMARLNVNGEAYRPEFSSVPAGHATKRHAAMPKVNKDPMWERELFLTPGGIYSEADIAANGKVLPSVKFDGVEWPHDDLKPGDKMCPVTSNKADSNCSWVVNGQTYEFCCSPCLTKFVGWAKSQPDKIKRPEEYVNR